MKSFIVSHKQKEYPYVSGPYDGPIFFGRTLAENMYDPAQTKKCSYFSADNIYDLLKNNSRKDFINPFAIYLPYC